MLEWLLIIQTWQPEKSTSLCYCACCEKRKSLNSFGWDQRTCAGKKKERMGRKSLGYIKRRKGGWRKAAHSEFQCRQLLNCCVKAVGRGKRGYASWTCLFQEHIVKRQPQCIRQVDYLNFGFILLASDCRNTSFLFLSLEWPHWRAGTGKLISCD